MSENNNEPKWDKWTNFDFWANQVHLNQAISENTGNPYYYADCYFLPDTKVNGINISGQNGDRGHLRVFLNEKQYHTAQEQKVAGEHVKIGVPPSQHDEKGKLTISFHNTETKENRAFPVPGIAISAANKKAHEAYVAEKNAEKGEKAQGFKPTPLSDKNQEAGKAQEQLEKNAHSKTAPSKDAPVK